MNTVSGNRLGTLVPLAILLACGTERGRAPTGPPAIVAANLQPADDDPPQFSGWSAPVNLGPMVNSDLADQSPETTKDGLSLYFARGVTNTNFDIWVSERASPDRPWELAQPLGSVINTDRTEFAPEISVDGHRMFFNSNRTGGFGGQDLYVSRRRDKLDNFSWGTPVNLGAAVNTSANEVAPLLFEDEVTGTALLYFASNRAGGPGGNDVYVSTLLPDETFGPPVLVTELSTPFDDTPNDMRRDGLEMFIASNRQGTIGQLDLWVSVRVGTSDPWSTPVNLGSVVNSTFREGGAAISWDGTTLYFHSNANRAGAMGPCFGELGPCFFDNYVTTRSKLTRSN
ncbi:MAG TPA: hypothetical protein VFS56_03360 [Gemmatimonadaceae bacterium]|nr:hypothetical protein [Gemmatimonadaceae bacterium]